MSYIRIFVVLFSLLSMSECKLTDEKKESSVLGLLYQEPEITYMTETCHSYGITKLERIKLSDSSVTYILYAKPVWSVHGPIDFSRAQLEYSIGEGGSISV